MRYILCMLICIASLANAQVVENFNDNNLNIIWSGDTNQFTIVDGKLRSNNTTPSSTFYTSTSSTLTTNTIWELSINLLFNTSSTNYVDIFLMADSANLKNVRNGYFVRIGNTTDEISLYKRINGTNTKIIDGTDAQTNKSNNTIQLKVSCDADNEWTLQRDLNGTTNYITEGIVTDTSSIASNYFGILIKQSTTSFHLKHFFDNIVVAKITPDTIAPSIISTSVISNTQLDILFNEPVDLLSSETKSNYSATNNLGAPLLANRDTNNFSLVHLTFTAPFTNELLNILTVTGIKDLIGNTITKTTSNFYFHQTMPSDLVINEILFDPQSGGVDFVEIYNRSNKAIDLQKFVISQYDTITNELINASNISNVEYFIYPKEYLVLSENKEAIQEQYTVKNTNEFLDLANLPSMNVDEGTICLATSNNIIDKFHYYANMHFGLLDETKGVSLERIDFNRPTEDRTNWHSAAQTVGFATPTYQNSQYQMTPEIKNTIEVAPEIFSPDEDGYNDIINISYNFNEPGIIANINILDSNGQLIKQLLKNELIETQGTISWNGINELGEKARIGIYVIHLETFNLSGTINHYKKICVLGGEI